MKLISWNVNGLRACMQKGFLDFFQETDADIFCLQETKLQEGQIALDLPGYHQYWNYAEKKGYSGTAIFTKEEPIQVTYGIGVEEHDHEGRVITAEYSEFYFVTVYVPNAQSPLMISTLIFVNPASTASRYTWQKPSKSWILPRFFSSSAWADCIPILRRLIPAV